MFYASMIMLTQMCFYNSFNNSPSQFRSRSPWLLVSFQHLAVYVIVIVNTHIMLLLHFISTGILLLFTLTFVPFLYAFSVKILLVFLSMIFVDSSSSFGLASSSLSLYWRHFSTKRMGQEKSAYKIPFQM